MKTTQVNLSAILAEENIRKPSKETVSRMAASLAELGQLSPIGLIPKDDSFVLVYGFTRYLAAKKLGWQDITANVYPDETTPVDCLRLAINENLVRQSMSFLEEAEALLEYAKQRCISTQEAGAELNYRQPQISKIVGTFERLTPRSKKRLVEANVGFTLAYLISKEPNQDELVELVIENGWTRSQLLSHLKQQKQPKQRIQFCSDRGSVTCEVNRHASYETVSTLIREFAKAIHKASGHSIDTIARILKEQSNAKA